MLPIEQGRHLQLPRHRLVCKLCHVGALCDERHLLLVCPAWLVSQPNFPAHGELLRDHDQACLVRGPAIGQQVHHSLP